MTEITSILEDIGLSEKEVAVYIAMLQLGEETASRISEIAELNRVTTYTLLKSLQEKGFCSIFEKNNVQYFKPIKPENIAKLLQEKKEKVQTIVPLLKQKQKTVTDKPEVMMFEGKKGVVSALEILIEDAKKTKEVFGYGNFEVANKAIEYESLHWRKMRIKHKIKIKAVVNKVIQIEEYKTLKGYKELTKVKENPILEKIKSYSLFSENYAGILLLHGELKVILIKDKATAEKEKFVFDMLWKNS